MDRKLKRNQGLYNSRNEKDSCGIGFVVNINNEASKKIVDYGLGILCNLTHRGAVSADPKAGDGVGILTQIPHEFFKKELEKYNVVLPKPMEYAIGVFFLPNQDSQKKQCLKQIDKIFKDLNLDIFFKRKVPCNSEVLGYSVKPNKPEIIQFFIKSAKSGINVKKFEYNLFIARRKLEIKLKSFPFYVSSLSPRTIIYKGMIMSNSLKDYYLDLQDNLFTSSLAVVHQRFSTNTFPSWELAQPFRFLCHNGEINTLRGNRNWMNARAKISSSKFFDSNIKDINPLIFDDVSDSAAFDNALEYLIVGGYSIEQAMMLLIPEAWEKNVMHSNKIKSYYQYYSNYTEPWDGPAAMCFTDGIKIGGCLDRNGLRPSRYCETEDGILLLSSEMGVLDLPQNKIIKKWRLQPGKIFLIDLEEKRIIDNDELKQKYSEEYNYQSHLKKNQVFLSDLKTKKDPQTYNNNISDLREAQMRFGYTKEDLNFFLEPIIKTGLEPTGSMGTDTPISILSNKSKLLYSYFKQCFAQVTNPPIDPIREELVMSLEHSLGKKPNIFSTPDNNNNYRLEISQPILKNQEIDKIKSIEKNTKKKLSAGVVNILFKNSNHTGKELEQGIEKICKDTKKLVLSGKNLIILSDKNTSEKLAPIPALLAVSAVHQYLIKEGLRMNLSIIIETGEARELHHFAVLAGYGAEAINPYLAFETINSMVEKEDFVKAQENFIKASNKAILKIMSKMGISTFKSYCGAQIFDAVGISKKVIMDYFKGTESLIDGISIEDIQKEVLDRFNRIPSDKIFDNSKLDDGGEYAYRVNGEKHNWSPSTISDLQKAVIINSKEKFKSFSEAINNKDKSMLSIRSLLKIRNTKRKLNIAEVESASEIVKRFSTGAMSFGSISKEAHTTLAVAMNKIGGKSNTGEGGEEPERFKPMKNGDSMRSAIKQVASGRFGVTTEYLVNANDIQIKICQGAKPGEGGQLPGHKVDVTIAAVRHSTPGVGLISPPPHHDIYSIEDLAQLIYDLKNVNPKARISVKLVSEFGVGVVAAGVAKCKADHITIAGYDGGTGASPLTSIKNAGTPWELGLAETQQTLVLNKLRDRVSLQVDGGLKTGRDVVIGALLGAEEFGFATAPLISMGCIMMRKCHLNTCPVGVATQNPILRKKFRGTPENVINYFFLVAEEVREIMATMGIKKFNDLIGRSELLNKFSVIKHWKAKSLDLSKLLYRPKVKNNTELYNSSQQEHDIVDVLDRKIIKKCKKIFNGDQKVVHLKEKIKNTDRSFGAMLSGKIAAKFGHQGLKEDSIIIDLDGIAGQSFGTFLSKGITLNLVGEANDYVGKGLSGGRLIIAPPKDVKFQSEKNIIIGNTVLYGAISGECYFSGIAGERFAVRNSGAIATVEGTGDHCCEYMTGGIVMVLGKTGVNFAAGMSGGIAYVFDEDGEFEKKCNLNMVKLESIKVTKSVDKSRIFEKSSLLGDDDLRIKVLLQKHIHYTNSKKAKRILNDFNVNLKKFVKVLPTDFKDALIRYENSNTMKLKVI